MSLLTPFLNRMKREDDYDDYDYKADKRVGAIDSVRERYREEAAHALLNLLHPTEFSHVSIPRTVKHSGPLGTMDMYIPPYALAPSPEGVAERPYLAPFTRQNSVEYIYLDGDVCNLDFPWSVGPGLNQIRNAFPVRLVGLDVKFRAWLAKCPSIFDEFYDDYMTQNNMIVRMMLIWDNRTDPDSPSVPAHSSSEWELIFGRNTYNPMLQRIGIENHHDFQILWQHSFQLTRNNCGITGEGYSVNARAVELEGVISGTPATLEGFVQQIPEDGLPVQSPYPGLPSERYFHEEFVPLRGRKVEWTAGIPNVSPPRLKKGKLMIASVTEWNPGQFANPFPPLSWLRKAKAIAPLVDMSVRLKFYSPN